MATSSPRKLAVITGASSGIGYHLARVCAQNNFDLIVIANEPDIHRAAADFRALGTHVEALQAELSEDRGVDEVVSAIGARRVSALLANAATGLGNGFLDQDFESVRKIVNTNILQTLHLIHRVVGDMRRHREGRVLITGSIAGFSPGPFNAVYNASKAFIDSFSWALRTELRDTGVTVTCLMPGATETEFFERAGLRDTKLGQAPKDDPADVAEIGFRAMMEGDGDVVTGWYNKVAAAVANITPAAMLAEQHRKLAEPGSANTDERVADRA
ncbi:MAG: SDR family NAD(P)-dependent oxidoreductase [Hyphomicrobium sp.]|nr:SDR family NAD(P)-dependent oxidoreductase [Hyphomicrobium sp.]